MNGADSQNQFLAFKRSMLCYIYVKSIQQFYNTYINTNIGGFKGGRDVWGGCNPPFPSEKFKR